jgi:hypothetical protein
MTISTMRYKGYSWSHNPKTLKVSTEDEIKEQVILENNSFVRKLGNKGRVITGTGQLYGEDCIKQYEALLKLQSKEGSGILSLPDTLPFYAFFKSIELACDPTPEVVTYNFEFIEDLSKTSAGQRKIYHSALSEETLWDIAYAYNIDIEKLVELNPRLKRVDELSEGEQVRIC